jgi:anti-sigma regulatory factor (Ser/Thr protein kinase)
MPLKDAATKNFFGRQNELEVLQGVVSEAKAGEAHSIFLSGKRGIGKTKLLANLFYHLFNQQNDAIPFFYTIKTAFVSIENFSNDYLVNFILQSLAFLKKDPSLLDPGIYSIEDVAELVKDPETQWAADIIDGYSQIKASNNPIKQFLFAISAPSRSYHSTGIPVIAILDDFHKLKKFCEVNAEDNNRNFWILYENFVQSSNTPHIFTGMQGELHEMFFEETSLGASLEIINIPGIGRSNSIKLFTLFSELYGLKIETQLHDFIDIFAGNPFYIKNFLQAARQTGRIFSEEDLWMVYFSEVTKGKTYNYWTSQLKTYVPQFNLRKPCLRFLYHLCSNNADVFFTNPSELLSVEQEELEHIVSLLNISGAIETGFSEIKLTDDVVLVDIIKGLYHKEIQKESLQKMRDAILGDKRQEVKSAEPSFDITIPAASKAELVVVKSFEQIAQHFNIPLGAAAQLQIVLVELFANVLARERSAYSYSLKFALKGNIFSIEITIPQKGFVLSDTDRNSLEPYIDDIKVEDIMSGSKLILLKEISKDSVSAP